MQNKKIYVSAFLAVVGVIYFSIQPAKETNAQNEKVTIDTSISIKQAKETIIANLDTASKNNTEAMIAAMEATKVKNINVVQPIVKPSKFKKDLKRALEKSKIYVKAPPTPVIKEKEKINTPISKDENVDSIKCQDNYIFVYKKPPIYGGDINKPYKDKSTWMKENPGKKEKDYKQYLKNLNIKYND